MADIASSARNVPVPLAQTSIGWPQQQEFSRFSGDRNPMHTDPLAARRTPAGGVVAYGMHVLLWALETLASQKRLDGSPARLHVRFLKWIYLDDIVSLGLRESTDGALRFEVSVGDMVAITCALASTGDVPVAESVKLHTGEVAPRLHEPRTLPLEELEGKEGAVPVADLSASAMMFPSLARLFGPVLAAEIATCSYVVGMEAPGLHSIDSVAKWSFSIPLADGAVALAYRVVSVDPRFRRARIQVAGSMVSGTLEAFVRNPPVRQPDMRHVSRQVAEGEFAGMRALVVGGSRGLGEVAAKCIAAGGGTCTVTYATGKQDAESVVAEIRQAQRSAFTAHYDARLAAAPQLRQMQGHFTHVLYFASGLIFRPRGGLFSAERLAEFNRIYVEGLYGLCVALLDPEAGLVEAERPLTVFYPSTSLLNDRGAGFTEYAASKAAGEQLCHDMNRFLSRCRAVSARLPRLLTDQTVPMVPERFPDSVAVLLPLLRELQ